MASKGSLAFDRVLTRIGSEREVARMVGVSPGAVNHWRKGKRRPGVVTAERIRKLWGIAPTDWYAPVEVAA